MKIDTKDHMVSIPFKQYTDIVSKLESQDHLAKKFQDVIRDMGSFWSKNGVQDMGAADLREILAKHNIELFLDSSTGERIISARMIKPEEK